MTKAELKSDRFNLSWHLPASPPQIFNAWARAKELTWFLNDAMPRPAEPIEVDLEVGGAWRLMMVIDQQTRYFTGGVYREILPDRRIVFAWGAVGGWPEINLEDLNAGPQVEVIFELEGAATRLTIDVQVPVDFKSDAPRDQLLDAMKEGWRDTVDRLSAACSAPHSAPA